MADVLITPSTGLIEFKDNNGVVDAVVQLDGSGNLNITHPGGNLNLGNPGTPVYIGDGINSVDVIFEQNGAVRALTGKTLTLGQSDSNVAFAGTITSALNISSGVANTGINLNNNSIVGVNHIIISDPGPNEGLQWSGGSGWQIYESPDNLTTNSGGNLQFVTGSTRRATFNTNGQLDLPVATGAAPLVVASTTRVANLNAATAGNADTVTNGVYTTGDQTIGGVKTFSSSIIGSSDIRIGDVTGDNYLRLRQVSPDAYGVTTEFGNGSVITNEQGSTNQFIFLADTGATSAATLFAVGVGSGTNPTSGTEGAWETRLALTGTGNLSLVGTVTGTRLSSTIATGTAPFTVASTTRVANLNVATAGNADTATNVAYSGLTGTVPTWNQNTTGSAATLTTARTLTIGSTGKTFNGSANVSWTLAEIGAYAATNPSGYTSNTGTVTSVGGTGGYGGLTLSGTVTTTGNITLGGTPTGTWPISVSGSSASTTGNAATATALQTARTINGVSFNGTANINIATKLVVLSRAATSVDVSIANALLSVVNRAGSTINVAVS